jgi:hypothetical protein
MIERLTAVYSIFSTGYGPEVTNEIVAPMRNPMKTLVRPIAARVADITGTLKILFPPFPLLSLLYIYSFYLIKCVAIRASFPEGKRLKLKRLRQLAAVVRRKKHRGNIFLNIYF